MRISLVSGETTVHLAGNPLVSEREHTSAADLSISADIVTQSREGVRRDHSYDRDRGNLKTVISFTTRRLFATASAAQQFALDYDRVTIRYGTLKLTPMGGGDVRQLENCLVRPPVRTVYGLTVTLAYTCTGGEITIET